MSHPHETHTHPFKLTNPSDDHQRWHTPKPCHGDVVKELLEEGHDGQ